MKSGWVHELKSHAFSFEGIRFVIMAIVTHVLIHYAKWNYPNYVKGQALTENVSWILLPWIILYQNEAAYCTCVAYRVCLFTSVS